MALPHFSLDDLRDELRRIFLIQAGLIMLARGMETAEAYVGFLPEHDDPIEAEPYDLDTLDHVDLLLFPIVREFETLYRQVFEPREAPALWGGDTLLANNFVQALPEVSASGIVCEFPLVRRVAETAYARSKLDEFVALKPAPNLSVREIALLADMTEGAVRNAISSQGPDRLRTERQGKGISIKPLEALRWLAGRRGFVTRPCRPMGDGWFWKNFEADLSRRYLAYCLEILIYNNLGQPAAAAAKLGWLIEEVENWIAGRFPNDAAHIAAMADALGLDADRLRTVVERVVSMEAAR
ncbi:hypothetical protein VH569_31900 [Azospirillum sp. 11R-A]|uniref:hypothetical protein n=1 Tax=Azospirillum sp. 11R-A TaxID=3111634 RepID=UPI003C26F80B